MNAHDRDRILRILDEGYVSKMYVAQFPPSLGGSFHESFRMLIPEFDGKTGQLSDAQWKEVRLNPNHRPNPRAIEELTRFETSVLDITG